MFTGAKSFDCKFGVLVEIVGKNNGIYIALEHFIIVGKSHKSAVRIVLGFDDCELFGAAVANSGKLQSGTFCRIHKRLTSAGSDNSYSDRIIHVFTSL